MSDPTATAGSPERGSAPATAAGRPSTLEELLADTEGLIRLVVGKSMSVDLESGNTRMVHTVHMYAEPDNPRRKAQQIGPVLVGESYTELLTAIATVLDKESDHAATD